MMLTWRKFGTLKKVDSVITLLVKSLYTSKTLVCFTSFDGCHGDWQSDL